jgi:peptidoglycan/LPS O-acetylase OafA/YrhL
MKPYIHFSGLNGLRAIAALAVVFSHATLSMASFGLNPFVFGTYPDGNPLTTLLAGFGVSIFFALSGFLITYLLMQEKSFGSISINNFYMRRILRIFPLYYLYLILAVVTTLIFGIHFEVKSLLFYIFFSANVPFILGGGIPLLLHYWSLGVEEQFYAFWVWVIKKSKSILASVTLLLAGLMILKCSLRVFDIYYHAGQMNWLYQIMNITRFQCMAIGAIGAIFYFQRNKIILSLIGSRVCQLASWIIIFFVLINKFHIASFLDNEILSVVTVFLIIGQAKQKNRIINLDNRILEFIGKRSYGIYVWHPLVIFYFAQILPKFHSSLASPLAYSIIYLGTFILTVAVASISYNFFEKKFLNMKEKYSVIQT